MIDERGMTDAGVYACLKAIGQRRLQRIGRAAGTGGEGRKAGSKFYKGVLERP